MSATALWVAAKLEEVKEVRDHPRKLLEMVMVAVDRSINRRETLDGRKLAVLDTHSKVGDAEKQPSHMSAVHTNSSPATVCSAHLYGVVVTGLQAVMDAGLLAIGLLSKQVTSPVTAYLLPGAVVLPAPGFMPGPCLVCLLLHVFVHVAWWRAAFQGYLPGLQQSHHHSCAFLQEGEEFRRALIRYESEMLKAFGFIMNVEHPHRLLCNYCQILFAPYMSKDDKWDFLRAFIQESWNVANDR